MMTWTQLADTLADQSIRMETSSGGSRNGMETTEARKEHLKAE